MAKSIKAVFSFRYGVIILAIIIGSVVIGYALQSLYPANMEQYLAQDARMQKEAVSLAIKGRGPEAAAKLQQIADRKVSMAANLPPRLKRAFEQNAARFRELARSVVQR